MVHTDEVQWRETLVGRMEIDMFTVGSALATVLQLYKYNQTNFKETV